MHCFVSRMWVLFWFCVCGTQKLFLALCSRMIPDRAKGSICSARASNWDWLYATVFEYFWSHLVYSWLYIHPLFLAVLGVPIRMPGLNPGCKTRALPIGIFFQPQQGKVLTWRLSLWTSIHYIDCCDTWYSCWIVTLVGYSVNGFGQSVAIIMRAFCRWINSYTSRLSVLITSDRVDGLPPISGRY